MISRNYHVSRCLLFWATLIFFAYPPHRVQAQKPQKEIVIASKNLPENRLLAEIMAQLVEEHTDIAVERKFSLGATGIVIPAMESGSIDLYPEYTGTGWAEILKIREPASKAIENTNSRWPLSPRVFLIVDARMRKEMGLGWLQPFGFENSFALAIAEEKAQELDIKTISDLVDHQDNLRIAVSTHFATREDGWVGLSKTYGLKFKSFTPMEHNISYQALEAGSVDLIQVDMTDGKLARLNMRLLEDDKNFFPPYDAAPVIRLSTLKRYPELEEVLGRLAFKIDQKTMQELNRRVAEGESVRVVAASFLKSIGASQRTAPPKESFARRARVMLTYLLEHLYLVGIALVLAILVAVPVGILLTRYEWATGTVLGVAGVIQTIPSLALLMFMIPILAYLSIQMGPITAIAALFLYALLPIVRNTYTGIKEIDEGLIEAARGIGLTNRQILWKIELPLATRTIMAGIRTSTVIGIGVATLAAFIGGGGLGTPIVIGLQRNDQTMILFGAIPAALLALLVDFLLGRVEWWVRPKGVGDN